MNIFALDFNPAAAAKQMVDSHVVKMILESAQMLCTVHRSMAPPGIQFPPNFYQSTHSNHPCTKWVMQSPMNYHWLYLHARGLCAEYESRYKKVHKTKALIETLDSPPAELNFASRGIVAGLPTPFALAMPDRYKNLSMKTLLQFASDDEMSWSTDLEPHLLSVYAYRAYYVGEKQHIFRWKKPAEAPWWAELKLRWSESCSEPEVIYSQAGS